MLKNNEVLLRVALLTLVMAYKIKGRKKLQKITYMANCTGWNVIQDFRFHHYGPYSDYTLSAVENLRKEGLVKVSEERTPNDNPVYFHELTEEGHSLLEKLSNEIESPELIHRTEELVDELNRYSSEELEIMASLYYLYRESPSISNENLISRLSSFKPHISSSKSRNGLRILEIMKKYQS